ncbi:MAG: hypothetical protein F4X48_01275 [Acidimicrobiia bacterium]|nr:hypothetical protein [Acidimicrobiia bacterium]MYC57211.1 hypothetical protein [Acidimicrobiia bacterium]MYI29865.1 hypothetical protein [Acidimicrobiia bacterium]
MSVVSTPGDRIAQFLRENPSGQLWVTVGFSSAFGLAWLEERTAERPVKLLIGDYRTGFSKYTEADRLAAIRFIQRQDVSVRNWYRKRGGYRVAHAKAWIVDSDLLNGNSGAVLVGSANLTKQGLLHNVEMMTLADPDEHERLRAEMRHVMDKSWPIEDELLERLGYRDLKQSTSEITMSPSTPTHTYQIPKPAYQSQTRHSLKAASKRRRYQQPRRAPALYKSSNRHRRRLNSSARSRLVEMAKAVAMVVAGLVLLAMLPHILEQCEGIGDVESRPNAAGAFSALVLTHSAD